MKISKIIPLSILAICSINANAFDLNISFDNALLRPNNKIDFSYKVISCDNLSICGVNASIDGMQHLIMPMQQAQLFASTVRKLFATFALPAKSLVTNADSFVSLDIISNGRNLLLPGCTRVISGQKSLSLNVTPNGCA